LKKLLALIFLLNFSFACKEEEIPYYDKLTADEQRAIREMGKTQCLAKVTPSYDKFKKTSAGVFASKAYNRGNGFEFQFKNGSTVERTVGLMIWKRTASEIYFYVTDTRLADYFLKFSKADNDQMIDDLKEVHCLRPEIYVSSISSSLTMTDNYILPKGTDKEEYDDKFTMGFNSLAFFANYNINRTKKVFDVDDRQVGNTVTYTSTFVSKAYTFASDNYQAPEFTQNFCDVTRPATGYRFANERNVEGFKISNCSATLPAGWNLAAPFNP
jgi:hypothetical protein